MEKEHVRKKAAGFQQKGGWLRNFFDWHLFVLTVLHKKFCKTGLPVSDGWGAVSEIAVKTRLLGLQAP